MGQPKQRLVYQQKTLLQHAMQAANGVAHSKLIVVLGANNQAILSEIDSKKADIVINPEWEQGMATSIKAGITALQTLYPTMEQALLMLCDQPFVTAGLLEQLIQTGLVKDDAIVACNYKGTIGVPVLFGRSWFQELLCLQGQEGAKKLLMQHQHKVITVPFDQGAVDIDTPEDYAKLIGNEL
jgi:molybdenum cofactor cytidylyltransferase